MKMRSVKQFVLGVACGVCMLLVCAPVFALTAQMDDASYDLYCTEAFSDVAAGFRAQGEGQAQNWLYEHAREEVISIPAVPFRVSPFPEYISLAQYQQIVDIGAALDTYFSVCSDLKTLIGHAREPKQWRRYIAQYGLGMQSGKNVVPYFLRPDLMVTEEGFSLVEVETSPFGLGLALVLDEIYRGNPTRKNVAVRAFLQRLFLDSDPQERELVFVFTEHTKRFMGQMETFAGLLGECGVAARVVCVDDTDARDALLADMDEYGSRILLYRCFYAREALSNASLSDLLGEAFLSNISVVPVVTSFYESKIALALFHEPGVNQYLKEALGEVHYDVLMSAIPKTWVVDNAAVPSWVGETDDWSAVGSLSRSKRKYVLKPVLGSWGRGISFLHKVSGKGARERIQEALDAPELFILQEMVEAKKKQVTYYDYVGGRFVAMHGAMRITPYFFIHGDKPFTMKGTVREKTLYIHGASDAVNMPVFVRDRFGSVSLDNPATTFRLFDLDGTLSVKSEPVPDGVMEKLIALLRADPNLVVGVESMQGWEALQQHVLTVLMRVGGADVVDILPRFFLFPNGSSSCYGWDHGMWRIMYDMPTTAGVDFKEVYELLKQKGVTGVQYRGGALYGENLDRAFRLLPKHWQNVLIVSRDGRHMIVRGVSKAVGARWLIARYGTTSHSITAYGDTVKFSVNGDQSMALNYGTFVPVTSVADTEERLDALLLDGDLVRSSGARTGSQEREALRAA